MAQPALRALVIANPQSAGGALARRWSQVAALLQEQLGAHQVRFTRQRGDARTLSRAAIDQGFELIVAVGGDGTISEVVAGLFDDAGPLRPELLLGLVHFGTGGDFCRSTGTPRQLRRGIRALRGQAYRSIDVGRVTYQAADGRPQARHFANIASFGLAGLVDQLANSSSKALGGRLSFALATARALRRYEPARVALRLDEGPSVALTVQNVAVANGRYFGGGMQIAPAAELDDGLFDVVVVEALSALAMLRHGHRLYRGTHLGLPQVRVQRARRVEALPLVSDPPVLLDVDGEAPGQLPARFEIVPGALRLKIAEPVGR
ncbi:MAG: diacylglycerol kinase family lipid kinase [Proteobacteria bacterium]|nr:diacylglycerol kinase family lipid kinase [Pseudomonadota bacterium]